MYWCSNAPYMAHVRTTCREGAQCFLSTIFIVQIA